MSKNIKIKKFTLAIIFITTAIIASCNPNKQPPPQPIPEVSTYTIQPERIELVFELPARTYPYLIAEVRPQVSGIIQKRFFNEGSDVRAGDLLYQIDPAPFQAAYENAVANLNASRKAADRARASLETTLANKIRQQATVELARSNRKRFEELAAEGAVSQSEKDQAVTEAQVAEATLKAIEAQVKSEQEAVGVAEAAIKQAEAALQTARINLGYTRITAPISGRIGKSNVTVGALVTAHQPLPLATIQRLDPIYVDATQSSTNLLRLKRNIEAGRIKGGNPNQAKVKLILEDGSQYPLEGTLKFSDVTVDPSTGSFILRMVFPNPKYLLLPGMYVRAIVQEGIADKAILIPQQAVSRDFKGNPIAFIVNDQGRVEQRILNLERAISDRWLISSGLSAGDRVIIEGLQKVRPGMPVKVVPFVGGRKEGFEAQKNLGPVGKKN
jgi:membrane fusion protein (multidrug efflux system)